MPTPDTALFLCARTWSLGDDDEALAYAINWYAMRDELHQCAWIRSVDGPWPAFPGLMIETDAAIDEAEGIARLTAIKRRYVRAARRRLRNGQRTTFEARYR
jgi:hypothetical protein